MARMAWLGIWRLAGPDVRLHVTANRCDLIARQVQVKFRPPPQNVLRRKREFLTDQIVDLGLREPRPEIDAKAGSALRIAENRLRPRSIRAGEPGSQFRLEPRIFAAQRAQKPVKIAAFHIAAWQWRRRRPGIVARWLQIWRKLAHGILGQAPVSRDLATENRK